MCIGGWGVLKRETVSFRVVRFAYARSGCLVELELKRCWLAFSLFPFGPGEPSLFPSPNPPNLLSNFS